jgi:hypothetical protein
MIEDKANGDEPVGHGSRRTQFKPGKSGNPRGSSKRKRNEIQDLGGILTLTLLESVTVAVNGHPVRMSKARALMRTLVDRAIRGSDRAVHQLLLFVTRLPRSVRAGTDFDYDYDYEPIVRAKIEKMASRREEAEKAARQRAEGAQVPPNSPEGGKN